MKSSEIIKIISAIRNSHPDLTIVYTEGHCFDFHVILRTILGNDKVELWHDHIEGHFYTKVGNYWYDIRGIHYKVSQSCVKCSYSEFAHKPHRWSRNSGIKIR